MRVHPRAARCGCPAQPTCVVVHCSGEHRTVIGLVVSENGCFVPFRYNVAPPGFPNWSLTGCFADQDFCIRPAEAPISPWKITWPVCDVSSNQVRPPCKATTFTCTRVGRGAATEWVAAEWVAAGVLFLAAGCAAGGCAAGCLWLLPFEPRYRYPKTPSTATTPTASTALQFGRRRSFSFTGVNGWNTSAAVIWRGSA